MYLLFFFLSSLTINSLPELERCNKAILYYPNLNPIIANSPKTLRADNLEIELNKNERNSLFFMIDSFVEVSRDSVNSRVHNVLIDLYCKKTIKYSICVMNESFIRVYNYNGTKWYHYKYNDEFLPFLKRIRNT
jgi:hypothetical protein